MNNKLSSTLKMATQLAVVPVLMFTVVACSQVKFSTVENNGTGVVTTVPPSPTATPGACTVETIYRKTKIIFLVDTSESNSVAEYNNINGQNVLFPASDPAKRFRGDAINSFFTTYQHKANFNWSFATFAGGGATAYIGTSANPQFSVNSSDMSSAISRFYSATDGGRTPYGAAINLATSAISRDPDLNSSDKPNYFVILLSDGFPTDYTDAYGNFKSAQMQSDVAALKAAAPGRVMLSTIYYSGQEYAPAVSVLKQIASTGGGQFAEVITTGSNNTFKIDDVISSGTICQ